MNLTSTAAAALLSTAAVLTCGVAGSGVAAQAAGATNAGTASSSRSAAGWTRAHDQTMRRGCHSYPYRYAITTPSAKWTAELRLIGPHGGQVASDFFLSGGEYPRSGVSHWKVCSSTSAPGRYTIKMRVTSYDPYTGDESGTHHAKPTRFRLDRR